MPAADLTRYFDQVVLVHPIPNGMEEVGTADNPLPGAMYVLNTGTLMWEPWTGGGGGGDASAANQTTEIARLEAIRDRLPTVLSGDRLKVELPAGGGGLTDAELRAAAVPMSLVAIPLGPDAATQTTLAAVLAKIIAAPATEAKQDTLIAKDFATQTTLAAVLAKIIAAPSTEAKQDTLNAKDFATQATLAAVLAKIIAAPATEATLELVRLLLAGGINVAVTNAPGVDVTDEITRLVGRIQYLDATQTLTDLLTKAQLPAALINGRLAIDSKADLTPSAPTATSVGVASAQAVAANAARKGLVLVNTSNNRISLGFGSAAVLDSGVTLLGPGGCFEMDEYCLDLGAVNAIASAAASNLAVQEYA